ncbi:MAG: ATP-binding protein [Desulfosalsimonadaceae bacterium]
MKPFSRSKIIESVIALFNDLTTPKKGTDAGGLIFWQERVVVTILLTALFLGLFAYIPSVLLCIKEKLWGVAVFDTVIYALVFVLLIFRSIPFSIRAYVIIFSSYLLGVVLLTVVGPSASGPVWLFAFPVLAGVILGFRASMIALLINTATLIVGGIMIYKGLPHWLQPKPHNLEKWITISLNFILLNAIAALSISMVLRGLQKSLDYEKSMRQSLEKQVADRMEAEKALTESERRYRTLFQGAAEGILIIEILSFKIIFANRAAGKMLKYDEDNLIGRRLQSLIPGLPAGNSGENGWAMEYASHPHVTDFPLQCSDGSMIYSDISNTKINIDNRDCLASFLTDITDRKIKEEEKKKLQEGLQHARKMESIGVLAGGIAHDFNNILSSIIGYTELSLDDVSENPILEDNLKEIYTAGMRAKDLVKQILTFARKTDEELKPIRVNAIARETLKLLRATIPTTIEIVHHLDSEALIMGNSTQVHQVLMNLCTNAVYAMEEAGGRLEINLSDTVIGNMNDTVRLNLKPGEYIQITISDTGAGMPPELIHNIFEPYVTTKAPGKGTGLGLAVVHGIVKTYGGEITVDSEMGKGTVFSVYLPVIKNAVEARAVESQNLPSGTERVLIVDDEVPIVKFVGMILKRLGYRVTLQTGSKEALSLFQSDPRAFDAVVTDMTMPNMTGDLLALELMKIRPDIPVILCTGYSNKISEDIAAEIGIRAFAFKPIVKADLAKTLRKVLDAA